LDPTLVGFHPRPPIRVWRVIAILLILMEMVNRVHPKTIDPSIEPKPQHLAHRLLDLRVAPIKVGLLL
jgi:hypothetical protein